MLRALTLALILPVILVACNSDSTKDEAPSGNDSQFSYGVASGDVTSDSAILWTRAEVDGSVTADIATDDAFLDGVIEAEGETSEERDFTVKVKIEDLAPDTRYYYRFRTQEATSAVGTFITAPEDDASAPLRFVFTGDADGSRDDEGNPPYNEFEVLDAAAAEDPAFFLFFGDTIYADRDPQAVDLDGYRGKHKENRGYAALVNILGATSTYNIWDDHEVYNDFAGTTVDKDQFADGLQAFREYMPIDDERNPDTLYRDFRWGRDTAILMLDQRSYRDAAATDVCRVDDGEPDPLPASAFAGAPDALTGIRSFIGLSNELPDGCEDMLTDPGRTLLGDEQKAYLFDWLATSDATWKIVVNPVPIQTLLVNPYDRWEGYAAERREVLEFIRDEGIENVVFLTTDFHSNIFGPVRLDPFDEPDVLAYEAIAGPIATKPLKQDIIDIVGAGAAESIDDFMINLLKADCIEMDSYAYAVVEIDGAFMTLTAKDETGRELCRTELEAE